MSLTKVQINLGTTGNLSGSRSLASGSFASRITTAETELTNTILSSSVQIETDISGSFGNQRVGTTDSPTFNAITAGTATITGTLTAQEIHTEFESASIIFTSGSTKFGDTIDDTHQVTGSLLMTGSMAVGTGKGITPNGIFDVGLNTDGTRRFSVSFEDSLVSLSAKNQSNNGEVLKLMGDGLRIHTGTNTSGTEKMRIDTDGKVGIGASSPTGKLSIAGASGVHSNIYVDNHAADQDGGNFIFRKSRNTSIGSHTVVQDDDDLGSIMFQGSDGNSYETGAQIVAEVDGTPGDGDMPGRLIFKTTADGASSATERIRIASDGNTTFASQVLLKDGAFDNLSLAFSGDTDTGIYRGGDGATAFVQNGNIALELQSSLISEFRGLIKHKGTSNDDYGNTAFETRAGNNNQGLKISHGGGNGKLELFGGNQSRTQFYANQITANVNGLEIKTTDAQSLTLGTNNTTRVTVDSSGQVGIGVSDPDRLLELESTGDCWIKVGSTAGTDRAFLVGTDSNHKFQVYDDTSDAMRFTIDTDGEVGIGTTSPDGQLEVVKDGGVAQLRVKSIGSGDDGIIDIEAISNKDAQIRFYDGGGFNWRLRNKTDTNNRMELFNGSVAGVFINDGSTSWSGTSDERVKDNIVEITNATDKLKDLRCVSFNWTWDEDKTTHLGLLAQDVEKVFPEVVSGDSSKDIEEIEKDGLIERANVMGVEYTALVPVLIKSVQELSQKIDNIEKKCKCMNEN